MKRTFVCLITICMLVLSLTACGGPSQTVADYGDATAFEEALNRGENLEGKTVIFTAGEFHPDSKLGYNIWAGEHLNFISERNPDVKEGDTIAVRTKTIKNVFGSWIISYEKINNAVIGEATISSSGSGGQAKDTNYSNSDSAEISETTSGSKAEEVTSAKETKAAAAVEPESEAEAPYYFKDLEMVSEDYTIRIKDWKVIDAGQDGNKYGDKPVIAFWYDTTNTSGKEIDPSSAWIYIMSAVQDNDPNAINKLNIGSHPDSKYLDSQMAKIKEGGTVTNAVAYQLTDKVTPVELTAKGSMFGDDIGSMTFDLISGEAKNGAAASIGIVENAEKVEPSFSDNIIVTGDYKIEILDYKVIPVGAEGNKYGSAPVIAFWYNTTNTSGKEIDPSSSWIYIMKAVQDNDPDMVNELNIGMLPDSRFLDSQLQKIKAGGTVENAVSYVLSDMETPVELIAKNGMFGEEIGSQVFDLK